MPRFRMYPLRANNVIQLFELRDQINMDPPYQRISVWDKDKQQRFIDSIMNGFDIPKLYFHEIPRTSDQASKYKYSVIDGKQRLQALWSFMLDKLSLPSDFVFYEDESLQAKDMSYKELLLKHPRLRARFDSFEVPITIVQSDDENFIENLFSRLNIQMPLSAPEFRNTLGGPVPYLIRKIAVSSFFKESVRITNNRLQHYDLAAKFIYLTRADDFASTHKKILDKFVEDFKRLRENGQDNELELEIELLRLESKTQEILDSMHDFFKPQDWLLTSQGRTTLYFHIFRICNRTNQQIPFTRQMLCQFDEELITARKKSYLRALGEQVTLSILEQTLVFFDSDKQSLNNGEAMKRRYRNMNDYFALAFGVHLPNIDNTRRN
jgi:hypothetical protein